MRLNYLIQPLPQLQPTLTFGPQCFQNHRTKIRSLKISCKHILTFSHLQAIDPWVFICSYLNLHTNIIMMIYAIYNNSTFEFPKLVLKFWKSLQTINQQTPNDRNSPHGLQLQPSKLKIDESGIKQSYSNQIHIKKKFYK